MNYEQIEPWFIDNILMSIMESFIDLPSRISPESMLAGFIGLFIGSFINVVAIRSVKRKSWIKGRSNCFSCGSGIPIYRNMPVVGWLIGLGKSSCCGEKIPARYIYVEIITGFMMLSIFFFFLLYAAIFVSTALIFSIIGSLIDLEIMEIPHTVNFLTFISMMLGWYFLFDGNIGLSDMVLDKLKDEVFFFLGSVAFFGFLYLVFRKAAFGFGDVFLLMAFMPILDISGVVGMIQVGYILLAVYLLIGRVLGREIPGALPMVPWLATAGYLIIVSKF